MASSAERAGRGAFGALLAAVALSTLLWPEAWFLGQSVYATDAIFAHLPWREALGAVARHNPELGDQDYVFFGQIAAAVRMQHEAGVLPTWNPGIYSGVPLSGNVQIPVLDPLHLALVLWQPGGEPFSAWHLALGLTWTGILRFVLCLHFCFLWLRLVCGRPWLSFAAAAAFAAGPYAALWWFSTPGQVLTFFPLALYALERRLRGGSSRWLALSAVGLALSHYGGYPQTTLFLALFLLGYVLWHGEVRIRRRALLEVGGVLGVSVLLALPLFVPFLEQLGQSAVSGHRRLHSVAAAAGFRGQDFLLSLGAAGLAVLVWKLPTRREELPRSRIFVFGFLLGLAVLLLRKAGSDGEALYWLFPGLEGHPVSAFGYSRSRPYIETNQDHVGLLAALLLVAALRSRASRVVALGLACVLLVASDVKALTIPLRWVLPLLEPSRAATMVPPLLALGLALAGRQLLALPQRDRPRVLQAAAFGALGFLLVVFWDHIAQNLRPLGEPGDLPVVPASSWIGMLRDDAGDFWAYSGLVGAYAKLPRLGPGTVFALGCLLVCLRGAPRTELFAKGLFAGAVGLLIWPGLWFQPGLSREEVFPRTEAIRFLEEAKARDPDLRVYVPNQDVLPGNTPSVYGIDRVLGNDGLDPEIYLATACSLVRDPAIADKRWLWSAEKMQLESPLFDLFAARLVVAREGEELPAHFVERFRGEGVVIAENPRALPKFLLVGRAVDLSEDPRRVLGLQLRSEVGLHDAESTRLSGKAAARMQLRVLERGPNGSCVVETDTDGAAWLVLNDSWWPGWRAWVGEEERPVLRANLVFRAVEVPAGVHRVRLAFAPPGLPLGWWGFLAGCLVLLGVLSGLGGDWGRRRDLRLLPGAR